MSNFWRLMRRSPALLRAIMYLLATVLVISPLWIPLYQFEYTTTQGQSVIWTPLLLLSAFALLLPFWMRRVHQCQQPWRELGIRGGSATWQGWLLTFLLGIVGVGLLYGIQLGLGWSRWVNPTDESLIRNLLEGLLVGVGVGLAEEFLFRGWLLFELEQDYAAPIALVLNATIFAIAHYLRPLSEIVSTWPQFVGLFLLGVALVWARRISLKATLGPARYTSLGPTAGLHGGLVFAYYQFDVNDLVVASGAVPDWVTGIGGNPLAGLLGLALLGLIAFGTYMASRSSQRYKI